ncbi:ABC transporter permease [Gorillibacterium timonense]|uniref:ABC transporter permease n=1 Tax=Gorillibacterium timonense TaxID=1689269 RepID=UPI000B2B2F92|nr:ABC transporter permease [Gorillibacterium timonense]
MKASAMKGRMVNPVLSKEFRLRMRTLRSPLALLFYLLAFGAIALGYLYITRGLSGNATNSFNPSDSRSMFYILSVAQLCLIGFMTPGLTAGVISNEREKQTLNMLLTTQQSSTAIILSKLASSLSFMLLIVISTMPIYGIVFLFGGISPKQLGLVFLFYVFVMFVLGSFGVLFSTLLKRTIASVIVTYGTSLFLFGGTGIAYLFCQQFVNRMQYLSQGSSQAAVHGYNWAGYILGLNPVAALISLFEEDLSGSVFRKPGSGTPSGAPIELWQLFLIVMAVLAVLALLLSIRHIRPSMKKKRK